MATLRPRPPTSTSSDAAIARARGTEALTEVGRLSTVSVVPRWLQHWRVRHQYASAVRLALQGHALLDRVRDGDPGTPSRILVPHVAAGANSALRWGSRLTQQGLLAPAQYAQDEARLNALLERIRAFGE